MNTKEKKIMLLMWQAGGAHISVCRSLRDAIREEGLEWKVDIVNFTREISGDLDPLQKYLKFSNEDLYNFLLRKKLYRIVTLQLIMGTLFIKKVHNKTVLKIKKFMEGHNPDYVVSCVHHFNNAIADALHAMNIPFGIVPTELMDLEHSPLWFSPLACRHASFFALALEEMVQQGMRLGCNGNCIKTGSLVIKRRFYEKVFNQFTREEMADHLCLSPDMFTILVTMGGAGSKAIFDIIKRLDKADWPLQIIACCGKDETVKHKLERHVLQSRNRLHILGFTNSMENYMKASNLVLTKPGPTTIWEALAAKVPLLLDTKDVIIWEKSQVDFVVSNGFGCAVSDHALFVPTIQQLRENNCALLSNISARMQAFPVSDATVPIINQIKKTISEVIYGEVITADRNIGIGVSSQRYHGS